MWTDVNRRVGQGLEGEQPEDKQQGWSWDDRTGASSCMSLTAGTSKGHKTLDREDN